MSGESDIWKYERQLRIDASVLSIETEYVESHRRRGCKKVYSTRRESDFGVVLE